jgi:hypothetical protein
MAITNAASTSGEGEKGHGKSGYYPGGITAISLGLAKRHPRKTNHKDLHPGGVPAKQVGDQGEENGIIL